MSWVHSICDTCWRARNGEREPVRIRAPESSPCCFCGERHASGIYVRHEPAGLYCRRNDVP